MTNAVEALTHALFFNACVNAL